MAKFAVKHNNLIEFFFEFFSNLNRARQRAARTNGLEYLIIDKYFNLSNLAKLR
jgi:hypothetical protein